MAYSSYLNGEETTAKTGVEIARGGLYRAGGQFWPAKFVFALANIALHKGVNLQCNTQVLNVETSAHG